MRTVAALLVLSACGTGSGLPVGLPAMPGELPQEAESLGVLMCGRESVRLFGDRSATVEEAAALLWAACGSVPDGRRTVPSAGALYPLDVYLVAGSVDGIDPALYRYLPLDAALEPLAEGDFRASLSEACLGQPWVASAPASLVICARTSVTASRYGGRALRYATLEAGHSSQNVYLMCEALGLGTVAVGAFDDSLAAAVLMLEDGIDVLYVMPFGEPAARGERGQHVGRGIR